MWTDEQIKMFVYEAKDLAEIERTMISMRNYMEVETARRNVLTDRIRVMLQTMENTLRLLESKQ